MDEGDQFLITISLAEWLSMKSAYHTLRVTLLDIQERAGSGSEIGEAVILGLERTPVTLGGLLVCPDAKA